jgi:hypothetical protein
MAAFGTRHSAGRSVVQIEGFCSQISAQAFRKAVDQSEGIRTLIVRYTDTLMALVHQSAGCNALHPAEKRLCRWLLPRWVGLRHGETGDCRERGNACGQMQKFSARKFHRRASPGDTGRYPNSRASNRCRDGRLNVERAPFKRRGCQAVPDGSARLGGDGARQSVTPFPRFIERQMRPKEYC